MKKKHEAIKYIVISSGLGTKSKSRIMANMAISGLMRNEVHCELIDLSDFDLPVCDGGKNRMKAGVRSLQSKISDAGGILISTPVYNYNVNAAIKNLVELTGDAWKNKVIGLLCSAGGQKSYMAAMSFAGSLMLDYRCLIIPRFVYAVDPDFSETSIVNEDIIGRIDGLVKALIQLTPVYTGKQV